MPPDHLVSDQGHPDPADELRQAELKDNHKSERDLPGADEKVADQVRVSGQGPRDGQVLPGAGGDAQRAGLRVPVPAPQAHKSAFEFGGLFLTVTRSFD